MSILSKHPEVQTGLPAADEKDTAFESRIIRDGAAYWDRLRGERPYPLRRDVDPLTMPRHLLPYVLLIDIISTNPPDFRWRLIGTHVTGVMGRDSTGRVWSELYSEEHFETLTIGPRTALTTGQPCRTVAGAPDNERNFITLESIDLPLSTDGVAIDMLLAFSHWQ
ncbi:PAS domain-containing protein [Minwuia sp.]|uniref:PAS domain-containing protein n=1 Tax=Minwuia sp. TaxID=2493630 RepID=UPI003A8D392B